MFRDLDLKWLRKSKILFGFFLFSSSKDGVSLRPKLSSEDSTKTWRNKVLHAPMGINPPIASAKVKAGLVT